MAWNVLKYCIVHKVIVFIKIFCENNFDTNDSDMNFILLQRRSDASCIIFKLQVRTIHITVHLLLINGPRNGSVIK